MKWTLEMIIFISNNFYFPMSGRHMGVDSFVWNFGRIARTLLFYILQKSKKVFLGKDIGNDIGNGT